ncbi:hypothetical protein C8A05DRAFT_43751 [Staphylotrichum tortipilum]|uniref:Uncharacterized protein n=1 Tax=Staphylotrichum tortipilum TaxID=2831512 RepID=A0AAN6MME9_9PEZI|nr:hypothetical protein C8A05DRAFT_43751 [Staphylotrichum longicolle]
MTSLQPPRLAFQSLSRAFRPHRAPPPTGPRTRPTPPPTLRTLPKRPYSTSPNPNPSTSTTAPGTTSTTPQTRLDRLLSRLPPYLQRYAAGVRGAALSHVVAFLALHELTAVVPLAGLFALFHYTEYAPVGWVAGHFGGYLKEGVGRFERYFRRKGWIGDEEIQGEEGGVVEGWAADGRYRVVVEVGLAYALTKVLLPVRIVVSLWATPWVAGVLGRVGRLVRRGR